MNEGIEKEENRWRHDRSIFLDRSTAWNETDRENRWCFVCRTKGKGGSERRAGGRWNMGATGSRKSQATVWKMIRGRGGGRISAITRQQCN